MATLQVNLTELSDQALAEAAAKAVIALVNIESPDLQTFTHRLIERITREATRRGLNPHRRKPSAVPTT